jgi:hypothetical protein
MSFKVDNFQEFPEIIPYIKKINKYIKKDKIGKLASKIEEFEALLEKNENLQVPITYILSILIENYPEILNSSFIRKIEPFINSNNIKLKLNSIITYRSRIFLYHSIQKKVAIVSNVFLFA